MKIHDITWKLQDAPVYPGSVPPVIDRVEKIADGAVCNLSRVEMPSHAGTHADALCHFIDGGLPIDEMPLEHYYGPCRVLSCGPGEVGPEAFRDRIGGIQRLVIHGGGKTFFSPEAARLLVDAGIITVVTDAMSTGPLGREKVSHDILLGNGIAIVETVNLEGIPDGDYTLIAFPVKYGGCDGAPVRAVLIED